MSDPTDMPLLVSHHVQRWHRNLVPDADGQVVLVHRATDEKLALPKALWDAVQRVFLRPRTISEALALLSLDAEGEALVRGLVEARFLVDPAHDFWDDYHPELSSEEPAPGLGIDRLRAARDMLDPHGLWMYPTWLGLPALQWPPDLWSMQQLLCELRPRFIVETGVFRGGSTLFYASVCELLGHGEVVAVELRLGREVRRALEEHPLGRRIHLVEGDSADPAVIQAVSERIGGAGEHLVALDSDHSTAHVGRELEAYAPLVTGRGKLAVFDTTMSLVPKWRASNPHAAVRAFLAAHPEWRISPWAGAGFVSCAEDGVLERLPE